MRMRNMYYLLTKNLEVIKNAKGTQEKKASNNETYYKIENWRNVKKAYGSISTMPCFKELTDSLEQLFSENVFTNKEKDYETFSANAYGEYNNLHSKIYNKMVNIIEFYEAVGFDKTEIGFDIKMPPTNDFSEFCEYLESLKQIFEHSPYLKSDDESIKIKKVDVGSTWLEFFIEKQNLITMAVVGIGSSVLLMNLSKIVDKAIKIKSHNLTCKMQKEQWKTMGIKNDIINTTVTAYQAITDNLVEKCVEELSEEISPLANGEEKNRLSKHLLDLSEMMMKGMEIYASIDSPQEIKDLFPTSDEITSFPESLNQLLEGNKNDSSP